MEQQGVYISKGAVSNWFLGIISACSIAGILCATKLLSKIPGIQEQQQMLRSEISTIQSSVNAVRVDQQLIKQEQSRVAEALRQAEILKFNNNQKIKE